MSQSVRNTKIIGTGMYVPVNVLSNEKIAKSVNTSAEWIENTLGIKERRIVGVGQKTSDLATQAGRRAIIDAKLSPEDIDLIIVCTATPDRLAPSTSCIVQDKLAAYNAAAFDISAVCSGFLYGMAIASQFIASSTYKYVLVIGADTFSRVTDWNKRDCVFFGDGAGAAVFSHTDDSGFMSFNLQADGRGQNAFVIPKDKQIFRMDGKAVYDTATRVLPTAINSVLEQAQYTIDDVDYMIPHQPSIGILKAVAKSVGLPFHKVMTNMDKYANTSGATIPILLDETNKAGKLKDGDVLLFAAVGSGWTWGTVIMKW